MTTLLDSFVEKVAGRLCGTICAHDINHGLVHVWNANSEEQFEAWIVNEVVNRDELFDQVVQARLRKVTMKT